MGGGGLLLRGGSLLLGGGSLLLSRGRLLLGLGRLGRTRSGGGAPYDHSGPAPCRAVHAASLRINDFGNEH